MTWRGGALVVSPSRFCSWSSRPPNDRALYDEDLIRDVRRGIFCSGATQGVRRIRLDPLAWGHEAGGECVARLLLSLESVDADTWSDEARADISDFIASFCKPKRRTRHWLD